MIRHLAHITYSYSSPLLLSVCYIGPGYCEDGVARGIHENVDQTFPRPVPHSFNVVLPHDGETQTGPNTRYMYLCKVAFKTY